MPLMLWESFVSSCIECKLDAGSAVKLVNAGGDQQLRGVILINFPAPALGQWISVGEHFGANMFLNQCAVRPELGCYTLPC